MPRCRVARRTGRLGFILGAAGIGNAAGPLIGGALTDLLSLAVDLFLNLPVAAFAVFVTMREIKQDHPEVEDTRMDYAGIVTVSVGLVSLLLAFDQVIDWGWGDPRIIALLALSFILIARASSWSSGARATTRWSRRRRCATGTSPTPARRS